MCQVAPGNEKNLKILIYGSKGGLEWHQEHPNQLIYTPFKGAKHILASGTGSIGSETTRITILPSGPPDGFVEAFATIYIKVAQAIKTTRDNKAISVDIEFPTVADGGKSIAFIEVTVRSS